MLNNRLIRWFSRPAAISGVNSLLGIPISLGSHVGLIREENQDRVAAMRVHTTSASSQSFTVIALADGMGGMKDGAQCASRTLAAFFNALIRFRQETSMDRLKFAADAANLAVNEFSNGGGGATLSALLIGADQCLTLNVGDSRIYATVQDNEKEKVVRLTVDDSLEEAVGGHGKDLLQFIGMGEGLISHISEVPRDADRILITSDGVHFIRHETLCDVLIQAQGERQVAEQLITLAKWRGAPDNASLAITSLAKLSSSNLVAEETGVELWDPFGALHIMWVKHDHHDSTSDEKRQISQPKISTGGLTQSCPSPGALVSDPKKTRSRSNGSQKLPKPSKKRQTTKREKDQISKASHPQLTIEAGSEANQPNNKKEE